MFAIPFFQGALPRYHARHISRTLGQVVKNVDLDTGEVVPYPKTLRYVEPTKVGIIEAIYRFNPQLGKDFTGPITGYTQTDPVVANSPNHNLETGDVITISGINGFFNSTPIITDIDVDDMVNDGQSNVIINGTNFGATQGDGKVEIGRWPTYHDPAKEVQPVDTWTDTAITLTAVDFTTWADLLAFTLYVWITPGT